jgi:hypothetical protein
MTKTTNKHRKGLSHEERAAKVMALKCSTGTSRRGPNDF